MHVCNFLSSDSASWALRRPFLIVFTSLLALASLAFHAAQAAPEQSALLHDAPSGRAAALERYRYVVATGHNIGPRVAGFYDRGGGLPIFGLPLTEEIDENGARVQYFERARFDLRPDSGIALTPIGTLLAQRRTEPAFALLAAPRWLADELEPAGDRPLGRAFGAPSRQAEPSAALREFDPISGHTLGGVFGAFWRANRGLELFGRPISEELSEVNPNDGRRYPVQYFEHARLEWHAEFAGAENEVMLGLLGREYADARALDPALRAPARPIAALGAATLGFSPMAARVQNIALAANRLDGRVVAPGQELSFLEAVGEISLADGFALDDAIVGGELTRDVGGGVCYAATALYRAVFRAGLPIVEQHPHSRPLDRRGDARGFDAAVYSPGLDLRWRNDTAYPIEVAASVDSTAGTITVALWGIGDGRSVAVRGPTITNRRPPTPDTWRYDKSLGAGDSRKIADVIEGMDITIGREVVADDGRLLRQDSFKTHYDPRGALYLYSKDVTPPDGAIVEGLAARP